jgi:predicted phosphodiesterase
VDDVGTFKIAVLSDQHIDTVESPESWELAKLAFRTAAEASVDHVVLAGDTFDSAKAMRRDGEKVRRYLKRLGLWHRDRLTVVPGNHDIFHLPHRSSQLQGVLRMMRGDAQANYAAFCAWVDELLDWDDLLDPDEEDFFPHHKLLGDVHLLATDTTAGVTYDSANGFWREDASDLLLGACESGASRRILAMHHPPREDEATELRHHLTGQYPFGFPDEEFRRLRSFLRRAEVDAVVCGHVHENAGDPYQWTVGRTQAFMMGRTGGVHHVEPVGGFLAVGSRGGLRWRELGLRGVA